MYQHHFFYHLKVNQKFRDKILWKGKKIVIKDFDDYTNNYRLFIIGNEVFMMFKNE